MKSLAVWYRGATQEKTAVDIHINFWKLPTSNTTFVKFLDIGFNLHNALPVEKLFIYFPFHIDLQNLIDLGQVIVKGSTNLLNAIFNEDYQITSAAKSDYHDVKDNNGKNVFNIYVMNENNYSVTDKYLGTIISITLPKKPTRRKRTYLRLRVTGESLLGFSKIEKNISSVFSSAFTKAEIFDFRINSTRHLPNKLLEEIADSCSFNIVKVHLFYICSYRENYILSHCPFHSVRKLEENVWDDYIFGTSNKTNNHNDETMIAYHWKVKSDMDNPIDDFDVFLKTTFRHNDWSTIIKYIIFLTIFAICSGLITNYIFSRFVSTTQYVDTNLRSPDKGMETSTDSTKTETDDVVLHKKK